MAVKAEPSRRATVLRSSERKASNDLSDEHSSIGGILTGADAKEKVDAGATLIQIYTGLIYRGPDLVAECAKALAAANDSTEARN